MNTPSQLKASLKVQLLANDVIVAESEDPALWQNILSSIHNNNTPDETPRKAFESPPKPKKFPSDNGTDAFASDIGITYDDAIAACNPDMNAPYIHLDDHYWEQFKLNIPARGRNSVAAIALPAILLSIWFKRSGIGGNPTIKQCKDVLRTIHVEEKNVNRSIKNTEWLQKRSENLVINPTMRRKAIAIAKAYCLMKGLDEKE